MSKLTLEEKRLQQIRQQLFGKERPVIKPSKTISLSANQISTPLTSTPQSQGEAGFLKHDISKVLILSLVAVGSQMFLYYLSLQGIIRLDVFHIF